MNDHSLKRVFKISKQLKDLKYSNKSKNIFVFLLAVIDIISLMTLFLITLVCSPRVGYDDNDEAGYNDEIDDTW